MGNIIKYMFKIPSIQLEQMAQPATIGGIKVVINQYLPFINLYSHAMYGIYQLKA